jgi:exonuclease VII small subunit
MSDGIAALTEKLKTAQMELERATEALFTDVNSDNANGRYNQAVMKLDRAEAELEAALSKFKYKKY